MEISVTRMCRTKDTISDASNFIILWIKSGSGSISIDFETFTAPSNSIWFLLPGKRFSCDFSHEPQGWMIRFSKNYFKRTVKKNMFIHDAELFHSLGTVPKIILSPKIGKRVDMIAGMIDELLGSAIPNKESAARSLLRTMLVYCDSKCNIRMSSEQNSGKIKLVTDFKDLVEKHVLENHKVSEYASMLNVSPKYLNQVVKEVLDVNAKSLINEQILMMARRELRFTGQSVKEIAFSLGFSEAFHFSSYFKKHTGISPSDFRNQ